MSQPGTARTAQHQRAAGREFRSILFGVDDLPAGIDDQPQPECFPDLNLDQVVAAVCAPKEGYRLTGFFHLPLTSVDAVTYRQDVFQDLERADIRGAIDEFAKQMRVARDYRRRAAKSHYHYVEERWLLDSVVKYCDAVGTLSAALAAGEPASQGLRAFRDFLVEHVRSAMFTTMQSDAARVRDGLDAIRYNMLIKGNRITVGAFDDEPDYSISVRETFERFRQGAVDPQKPKTRYSDVMDHVEAGVLNLVAKVFPEQFAALDAFTSTYSRHVDATVARFAREIQFYVAYLDYIAALRKSGLRLTYPTMSAQGKQEEADDTFDIALATQLARDGRRVVCNDVHLSGPERIFVVTGPNNGGKTTLARAIGQLHYLASLGCPVAGTNVRLLLCEAIYTHFERQEDIATLAGRLQEELTRLRHDLDRASPRSLVILNEMFSSTTLHDALFLSKEILGRVTALDALGVCVTFLDELATLSPATVSMVSTVAPEDPATRTYKVMRKPADGRAYAHALADRYGLTYDALIGRLAR